MIVQLIIEREKLLLFNIFKILIAAGSSNVLLVDDISSAFVHILSPVATDQSQHTAESPAAVFLSS